MAYVRDASACSLPNSSTPMSQARIDAQNRRMARYARSFTDGNAVFNGLLQALGGNPVGTDVGNAGVPSTGIFSPGSPTYGRPATAPGGGGGAALGGSSPVACTDPEVLPLVTVFPIPIVATPVTRSTPAPAPRPAPQASFGPPPAPIQAPAPAPAPAPAADPNSCRTGNICLDLLNGCVSSTQVTSDQQLACSLAGYAGNRNRYPAIAALPNKPWLGSVDLNPPRYNIGMGRYRRGVGELPSIPTWVWWAAALGTIGVARGSFGWGKRR